jgi:hypothetical protein
MRREKETACRAGDDGLSLMPNIVPYLVNLEWNSARFTLAIRNN